MVFITLEDETGFANLILWRAVYEQFRLPARHSSILLAHGEVERQVQADGSNLPGGGDAAVIHLIVRSLSRLDVLVATFGPCRGIFTKPQIREQLRR